MRRACPLALALVALATLLPASARAQEEDLGAFINPDSVFTGQSQAPVYETTFDRDRSRTNWGQTLSYFAGTKRLALNMFGTTTTQDFTLFTNRSTSGQFYGHLDARPTKQWVWSLEGRFDMNSSTDGTLISDSRHNKLQVRTQYAASPIPSMNLLGAVYTEFQLDHDRSVQQRVDPADPTIDPTAVDTLRAQRDSSYTSGRKDGVTVLANWNITPWLTFKNTAGAGRLSPSRRSLVRDFANPLDGSGGGYVSEARQNTNEPTNNANYQTSLAVTRIPRSQVVFGFTTSNVTQSLFDKQLRGQERARSNRNSGTIHVETSPLSRISIVTDGGLVRGLREYRLRATSNSLVRTQSLMTTIARADTAGRVGISYSVTRSHNERQASQNGVVIDRSLGTTAMRKMSKRFAMDGLASVGLFSSKYDDPRGDQDIGRGMVSVGGGYRVSAPCSTTVHFSLNRSHGVSIDPSASGSNNVQTNYQMNATLRLQVTPTFTLSQDYVLSAAYKIFDYEASESNNYLNRTRRIDTNLTDSLFSVGFIRLTHNFLFRDSGTYARDPGEAERTYRVSVETYEQTLAVTSGFDVTGGVRVVATQSLFNQRNHFLYPDSRTNRNRFALTAGVEVNRTLRDGTQIVGALRHIGGYDEKVTPFTVPNEEDYWIAGFTFQRSL